MKQTYTSAEAKAALGINSKTFLRWLEQDGIQPQTSRRDHRIKLFSREQIEQLAEAHERVLHADVDEVQFLPRQEADDIMAKINALDAKIEVLETKGPDIPLDRIEGVFSSLSEISRHLRALGDRVSELDTKIKASESLCAALYERVLELERQMREKPAPKTPAPATLRPPRAESTSTSKSALPELPTDLVPLRDFYHGVPDTTVRRWISSGELPLVRGYWRARGGTHHIDRALDAVGRQRFYELAHTRAQFQRCEECPHKGS